jgi:hypothetical protein
MVEKNNHSVCGINVLARRQRIVVLVFTQNVTIIVEIENEQIR